jgi:DNA-binding NtrC family response regulator
MTSSHRFLLIQRDPRIRATYRDTLSRFDVVEVADPAGLAAALARSDWDAVLVSSPIGRRSTSEVVAHILEVQPALRTHLFVVAPGDLPTTLGPVRQLQPYCTRDDILTSAKLAVDGMAAPLAERHRHKLRWVVPESYDHAVDRAVHGTPPPSSSNDTEA